VDDPHERLRVICSREYLLSLQQPREHGYTNSEISEVATLLETVHQRTWVAVPRLYIVLNQAGLLRLRDLFLSTQHTDAHFPYSTFTLPKGMIPDDRGAFLRAQNCVLAGTDHVSQWDLGEHVRFRSSEQVPFERQAILGSGGSGQVEVVTVRSKTHITHSAFRTRLVRKIIKRAIFGRYQQGLETFKNELKVLKRIQHRHLVEIIGSYTDPAYAALIMSPVADCDLSDFLRLAMTENQKLSSMRTFFGCLATSLAYLHGKRIRHKDMKPSNILVQGSNVLITDFGLSKDCNDTRSTTEGPTGRTPKYCAPEVADHAPRSYSSDVWSLGCVYLEMLTVLKGTSVDQLSVFMREHGTTISSYHANMDAVSMWLQRLSLEDRNDSDNDTIPWIQIMLVHDRDSRPSAETLSSEIAHSYSTSGKVGEFCGICCRGETEEFVDIEMEDAPLFVPDSPLFEPEGEDVKVVGSIEDIPISSHRRLLVASNTEQQPAMSRTEPVTQLDRANRTGSSARMLAQL
jgi:serine/threonine protein kinase